MRPESPSNRVLCYEPTFYGSFFLPPPRFNQNLVSFKYKFNFRAATAPPNGTTCPITEMGDGLLMCNKYWTSE